MGVRCAFPLRCFMCLLHLAALGPTQASTRPMTEDEGREFIDQYIAESQAHFGPEKEELRRRVVQEQADVLLPIITGELRFLLGTKGWNIEAKQVSRCRHLLGIVTQMGREREVRVMCEGFIAANKRFDELLEAIAPVSFEEVAASDPNWPRLNTLWNLCSFCIERLRICGDDCALETVLASIGDRDRSLQAVMLLYVKRVSRMRPDIRGRMQELYDSGTPGLKREPQVLRIIEAIDQAEAERREIAATQPGRGIEAGEEAADDRSEK